MISMIFLHNSCNLWCSLTANLVFQTNHCGIWSYWFFFVKMKHDFKKNDRYCKSTLNTVKHITWLITALKLQELVLPFSLHTIQYTTNVIKKLTFQVHLSPFMDSDSDAKVSPASPRLLCQPSSLSWEAGFRVRTKSLRLLQQYNLPNMPQQLECLRCRRFRRRLVGAYP